MLLFSKKTFRRLISLDCDCGELLYFRRVQAGRIGTCSNCGKVYSISSRVGKRFIIGHLYWYPKNVKIKTYDRLINKWRKSERT